MSKRILVVEDQEDLRAFLGDFPSASGYTVIEAVVAAVRSDMDHSERVPYVPETTRVRFSWGKRRDAVTRGYRQADRGDARRAHLGRVDHIGKGSTFQMEIPTRAELRKLAL